MGVNGKEGVSSKLDFLSSTPPSVLLSFASQRLPSPPSSSLLRPPPFLPSLPSPSPGSSFSSPFDAQGAWVLVVSGPSAVEPERRPSLCPLGRFDLVQTRIGTGFPTPTRSKQETEDCTTSRESRESHLVQLVSSKGRNQKKGREGEAQLPIRLFPFLPCLSTRLRLTIEHHNTIFASTDYTFPRLINFVDLLARLGSLAKLLLPDSSSPFTSFQPLPPSAPFEYRSELSSMGFLGTRSSNLGRQRKDVGSRQGYSLLRARRSSTRQDEEGSSRQVVNLSWIVVGSQGQGSEGTWRWRRRLGRRRSSVGWPAALGNVPREEEGEGQGERRETVGVEGRRRMAAVLEEYRLWLRPSRSWARRRRRSSAAGVHLDVVREESVA